MLFVHCERRAASRADWTAGSSKEMRTAMMAITTSSSISVNPRRFLMIDGTFWERIRMGGNPNSSTTRAELGKPDDDKAAEGQGLVAGRDGRGCPGDPGQGDLRAAPRGEGPHTGF